MRCLLISSLDFPYKNANIHRLTGIFASFRVNNMRSNWIDAVSIRMRFHKEIILCSENGGEVPSTTLDLTNRSNPNSLHRDNLLRAGSFETRFSCDIEVMKIS